MFPELACSQYYKHGAFGPFLLWKFGKIAEKENIVEKWQKHVQNCANCGKLQKWRGKKGGQFPPPMPGNDINKIHPRQLHFTWHI